MKKTPPIHVNIPIVPPETCAFILEYGAAAANGKVRPAMWDKMADLEKRLIDIREAAKWAIEVGQVAGGSKLNLIEALKRTAPKPSPENAIGEARADSALPPHDQTL